MSYEKQNFVKGQILKADHLNHMEDGIAAAAVGVQGPKGDKGDVGPQGPKGDKGDTGPAVALDPTLSVSGKAADAKATGDAVGQLKEDKVDKKGWREVTNDNLLFIEKTSFNLMYDAYVEEGYAINNTTGEQEENDNACVTGYIFAENADFLYTKQIRAVFAFDINKQFLGYVYYNGSQMNSLLKYNFPINTYFVRFQLDVGKTDSSICKAWFTNKTPVSEVPKFRAFGVDFSTDETIESLKSKEVFEDKIQTMSANLLDYNQITKNRTIDATTGELITNSSMWVSPVYDVVDGETYSWNSANIGYATYDEQMNLLRYSAEKGGGNTPFTKNIIIENNEYYLRFFASTGTSWLKVVFSKTASGYPFYVPYTKQFTQERVNIVDENLRTMTAPYLLKKWACVGDSFIALNKLQRMVMERTGLQLCFNDGVVGRVVGGMAQNLTSENMADIDIITILAGTNDFGAGSKPLGSVDDLTTPSFAKDVNDLIVTIYSLNSNIEIKWIAPCQRFDKIINSLGLTIFDYVDVIKNVCGLYGIPVCDMARTVPINEFTYLNYLNDDKLHPSEKGYNVIAKRVSGFINVN